MMNGPGMYSTALCRKEYISDLLRCMSFLDISSFLLPKWQHGLFWLKAPSSVCFGSCRPRQETTMCEKFPGCWLQPMRDGALLSLCLCHQLEKEPMGFWFFPSSIRFCAEMVCRGLPSSPQPPSLNFSQFVFKRRNFFKMQESLQFDQQDKEGVPSFFWSFQRENVHFSSRLPVSILAASEHSSQAPAGYILIKF